MPKAVYLPPDLHKKLTDKLAHAQRRVDHFEGAAFSSGDGEEKARLLLLVEHWLGRLQGFTEALEIIDQSESD